MTTTIKEALAAGDVTAALAAAERSVRSNPGESTHRVALFQVMCVLGQWQRALGQLETIAQLDAEAMPLVTTYREAIKCEVVRTAVFEGRSTPLAFGEPRAWVAWLVEALQREAQGDHGAAAELRSKAFEEADFPSGVADGTAFSWFADSDMRLGPVCEAIVNGRYYWMPFSALAQLDIEPPEDLRDLVWAPAHFRFVNGGETVGLIPSRYVGTEAGGEGALLLARKTDWREHQGVTSGLGQRVFATGDQEFPVLGLRQVMFEGGLTAEAHAGAS